jgi:hypothetical protein
MSMPRYNGKRDKSEADIIEALEKVGAEVWPLDYPVDLLIRFRQKWHLLEVKTPYGKAGKARKDKRQEAQINFIETTGTPIVTTPMEALRAVGAVA